MDSRNANGKSHAAAERIIAVISSAILISLVAVNPFDLVGKATILSTGLNMPEALLVVAEDYLNEEAADSTISGEISANSDKYSAKDGNGNSVSTQKSTDLTKTPDDIAAITAKYESEHANDKKDGNIIEQTYGKSSATSSFENVLVRNTTDTKSLNIEKVLGETPDINITDKSEPTVLIFHTHTTESYELLDRGWYAQDSSTRSNDPAINMVRIGDEIEKQLTEAGYGVIHDTRIYDASYSGAYDRSRVSVEEYLEKYPSIQVVLDVHRDAIHESDGDKIKPVTDINGKKAAQIMIITGAQEGNVTDFPDWEYNLRFALQLQKQAEDLYPRLMRPVLFSQRKYNMDLSRNSVLLEMGSDANTLDEAAYSGRLIGNALVELLDKYED